MIIVITYSSKMYIFEYVYGQNASYVLLLCGLISGMRRSKVVVYAKYSIKLVLNLYFDKLIIGTFGS